MATFEGLPDPSQVSSADAAARLAAAEAANLAWRTNTAPVLAPNVAPVGVTQAEQADAAREAAKHAAAFHPAEYYGVNPASLGNVPLSQIASRYGTGFADIVQGYYTQNPTAEAQAIKQQYAAQHQIAENPFNPNSAAGIAWEVARTTGGAGDITESMKKTAGIESRASYGIDIFQGMSAVSGKSTVPTRLTGSGMIAGMPETARYVTPGEDVYMAVGGYQGVRVPGAKIAIDYATGEFGVYAPRTPGSSAYSLIGGGGRYSAQSGMFSVGKSLWDPEHTFEQSQIGGMQPVSEAYMATHSKAGAEAYGGFSRALTGNLLAPNEQVSRYYGEGAGNIANFAAPIAAGKAEAPGAKIPWGISASSPTMQYMDETGLVKGEVRSDTGRTIGEILGARPQEGRLVGSKVIAGSPTYGVTEAGVLPLPFVSKTGTPFEQNVAGLRQSLEKRPLDVYLSGGLVGEYFFGEKSPQVVQGFVGSVVDFATGVATLGTWQPAKERLQTTTPEGKVYEYGEYTKAGESLGAAFRERTGGYSEAQLEMYGRQLEQKKGIQYIPEKIVFGTGSVVATRPEKIVTAYGGGAALVVGGGVISGGLQAVGAGAGAAATIARAALTGGKYILPVVFTGAMGYSVTEGLTATPERTTVNIGKMLPEAAGAAVGGGSAYMLAGRNLPIGFKTTKIEKAVFEGEQPKIIPKLQEIQKSGVLEYGQPERAYIFNLQSGELVKTVTGTEGRVSSFSAIPELPYGGRYGVYHTHTAEPTIFNIAKSEAKAISVGDVSVKGAVMNIADYLTHRAEYKAGGGLPSAQDIVAARGVTAEYKSRYGYESGVVEQGVISPEGINIYGIGRKVRPLEEIYPSTEAMQRAFINYRGIPEGSLYTEYASGRKVPKKEQPTTYIFAEDIPIGVQSVRDIRKSPLGEWGRVPEKFEVAPSEFSVKTGTEVMDIGYVLTGRKAGALPAGVVEGLKPPAPLTRGIQLEYMEPGLPGVQGVLTGAPKATRPMTPAEAAFGLKLSVEPIGAAVPKGLETRFGGGTGISGKGLQQIVNPEIAPIVQKTTYGTSIESTITQKTTAARVAPAMQAAEAQRIVPSATTRAFERPVSFGSKRFEEMLLGITESEKRTPVSAPTKPATVKKIPTGMQIDLLGQALGKRKGIVFSRSTEPFRVATESEIRAQIAPTRRPAKEFLIREEIAPRQRPATEAEIMQMIKPTQRPVAVAEPKQAPEQYPWAGVVYGKKVLGPTAETFRAEQQRMYPVSGTLEWYRQKQAAPQTQTPSSVKKQVQPVITGNLPKQIQPPVMQRQQITKPSQKQTPYVVPKQTSTPMQTQQPVSYQKQTPYVPPVYPTVPSTPTPGTPSTPQKAPPVYVPPIFPGVPTYTPPTKRPPTKPPVEPPVTPGIGGFFWPAGTPGSTPGRRPRRAAFMETFMMGLDVGFGMGGRRPRAKSFTTPKKYKTKAPAAKKKGGKK